MFSWSVKGLDGEKRKLLAIIFFRILTITILLGSTTILNLRETREWTPVHNIIFSSIGLTYLLSVFYLLALKHGHNLRFQSIAQIFGDLLFWSCLIYLTGGLQSPFSFLYSLSIIQATVVLGKRGAFFSFWTSLVLFLTIVFMESRGIFHETLRLVPSFQSVVGLKEMYHLFLIGCMLFLTTLLGVFLADQVQSREEILSRQTMSLEMQKMLNRSIMAGISSGFCILDAQGRVTLFNRAAEMISGLPHSLVEGRPFTDLLPELSEAMKKELAFEPWDRNVDVKVSREGEASRWITYSFADLLNAENRREGTIVQFVDSTERHRLEERAFRNEKLAAVGQLAAGLAHEIRNPLASISGSIQMLKSDLPPGEENEKLAAILLRETDRLNDLIRDFLSYARPKPAEFHPVSLREILEDLRELLLSDPQFSACRLRVEYDRDLPEFHGDPSQIRQMFWNILKNAMQSAADRKPGVVWVRLEKAGNDAVRFVIQDNGVGMTSPVKERIFDPFFTTKQRGTGLGMSIVYQVVQSHQGNIEVESEPGKGTTFRLLFPTSPQRAGAVRPVPTGG